MVFESTHLSEILVQRLQIGGLLRRPGRRLQNLLVFGRLGGTLCAILGSGCWFFRFGFGFWFGMVSGDRGGILGLVVRLGRGDGSGAALRRLRNLTYTHVHTDKQTNRGVRTVKCE